MSKDPCIFCGGTKRATIQWTFPTEAQAARLAELSPDTEMYRDPVAMGLTLPKAVREDLERPWETDCPHCCHVQGRDID